MNLSSLVSPGLVGPQGPVGVQGVSGAQGPITSFNTY